MILKYLEGEARVSAGSRKMYTEVYSPSNDVDEQIGLSPRNMSKAPAVVGTGSVVLRHNHVAYPTASHRFVDRLVERPGSAEVVQVESVLVWEWLIRARIACQEYRKVARGEKFLHVEHIPHNVVFFNGVDGQTPSFGTVAIDWEYHDVQRSNLCVLGQRSAGA